MKRFRFSRGIRGLCAALALCLALPGCAAGQASADPAMKGWKQYSIAWFDVFDTVTQVQGYAESQEAWNEQMTRLHQDLTHYHQLFDIYNHYDGMTNLYDLNQTAAEGPVAAEPEILDLLAQAKEVYTLTDGRTNVAMGRLLALWHDARTAAEADPSAASLPDEAALEEAAAHRNIDDLILDEDAGTVYYADPELQLDVGSIGKGYAVEQVAQTAEARGLTSALISVGGNLRAIGHKPDGSAWTGGVENPWGGQDILAALELPDGASLVTSGDYQRYFELDGVRYHHLIDPETRSPAAYFDSVTVLCSDSGLADGLSTGLFCMSLADGQALVEQLDGVEALWASPDGSVVTSSGWSAHAMS